MAFQVVAQMQIVGQSQVFLEKMKIATHKIEKDLEAAATNFEEFQVLQLEELQELEEFQVQLEEMKFAAATDLEATTELEEFQVQLDEMKFAATTTENFATTTTENFATTGSFFYVYILMTEKYYQI
jgi:hypothetical protein